MIPSSCMSISNSIIASHAPKNSVLITVQVDDTVLEDPQSYKEVLTSPKNIKKICLETKTHTEMAKDALVNSQTYLKALIKRIDLINEHYQTSDFEQANHHFTLLIDDLDLFTQLNQIHLKYYRNGSSVF